MPAARQGDKILCLEGSQGTILLGDPTVRIEGQPAARMGDPVTHLRDPLTGLGIPCGEIELGFPTVNIGMSLQVGALTLEPHHRCLALCSRARWLCRRGLINHAQLVRRGGSA